MDQFYFNFLLLLTDSLFSLDPKATNAFFAAVLAYYCNIDCDSDHANVDIMVHNLLHSFDTFCGDDKNWNISTITTGIRMISIPPVLPENCH